MEEHELLDYFTPPETGNLTRCDLCAKDGKSFHLPAGWWEQMAKHLDKVHGIKMEMPE